jgi:hypothetical protein
MYASKRQWRDAKRRLEAVGCVIQQEAETEGTATFDPANSTQAELALKLIRKAPKVVQTNSGGPVRQAEVRNRIHRRGARILIRRKSRVWAQ